MRISIEYQANKDIFLSFVDFLRSMLGYFTLPLQREDNQIMVLAALSMQGNEDIPSFIKTFAGDDRHVVDYLVEEVLNRQSEQILNFLFQTSILNRLSKSLCDFVTNRTNSQEILEELERENLFTISLDSKRRWYRYHHLFAELLQQRLNIIHPDLINGLHSKVVIWYEMNNNLPEAIHHALAINDINTATRLIEKGALEAI